MKKEPAAKKAKLSVSNESSEEPANNNETSFERKFHISCFVENSSAKCKPIKCVIKHRFSDFIVNEIDEKHELVQLNSFDLPEIEGAEETEDIADAGEVLSEKEENIITEAVEKKKKNWVKLTEAPEDKSRRKVIHMFIANKFKDVITKTEDGFISIKFAPGQKDNRGNIRVSWDAEKLGGKFCSFVLYKEGLSTGEAIDAISLKVKRPASCFTFGGTKDKRGVTSQRVTAFKVFASQLAPLNQELHRLRLGNFLYTAERLGLGSIYGNRFRLFLRGICEQDETILTKRAKLVAKKGFINYFGLQRFGSVSANNHVIGRNHEFLGEVERGFNESGRIEVPSDELNRMRMGPEKKFLIGLQKAGSDSDENICHAFNFIPRPTRTMFVHAYQAYLWNMMASHRINQRGLALSEGDLVSTSSGDIIAIDETNITQYSIFDCVIPVLGSESQLPPNLEEFCRKSLDVDSISQSDFKNKIKDYNLPGDYRKLLVKPENFEFGFLRYQTPDEDVLKSDLQLMNSSDENKASTGKDGNLFGMKLSFDLPKSAYATMLIREITLTDTSQQFNKKESDEFAIESHE